MIKAYTHHKLQHEYVNTSIHSNHHTKEQDPTADENKRKTRTTSTLLIPGSRHGTYPLIEEEEELQIKQALLSRHIIALPLLESVIVVIYDPRGLSNPITMGIKTSKA